MKNRNTKQTTTEQAKELVTQIIRPGDDEAACALAALVSALAAVSDEGARLEMAATVAERAYTRTDAFGDAVFSFMRGASPRVCAELSQ